MITPTIRDLESDRLDACKDGYAFAVERKGDFARIWDECPKGRWMIWMIGKFEVEFDCDAYWTKSDPLYKGYWAKRSALYGDFYAQSNPIDDDFLAKCNKIDAAYALQTADLIRSMMPNPFRK